MLKQKKNAENRIFTNNLFLGEKKAKVMRCIEEGGPCLPEHKCDSRKHEQFVILAWETNCTRETRHLSNDGTAPYPVFFLFIFSWRCHFWLLCWPDVCRPSASQQAQLLWDHGCHGNAVFLSLSSSSVFSFPVSSLSWSLSHGGSMIWMFYLMLISKPSLLLCPFLNLFKLTK